MVEEYDVVEPEPQMEDPTDEALAERMSDLLGTSATAEEKQNVHTFLHNVAIAKDTTKTGFLSVEELGTPILPVRTYKELALFCKEVANMDYFFNYFKEKAEIITSTSLSKEAKLLSLAVVSRTEISEIAKPPRKENKGWFKPRNKGTDKYGVPRV